MKVFIFFWRALYCMIIHIDVKAMDGHIFAPRHVIRNPNVVGNPLTIKVIGHNISAIMFASNPHKGNTFSIFPLE